MIIQLDTKYYKEKLSRSKHIIILQRTVIYSSARLNGKEYNSYQLSHQMLEQGGVLELWLGDTPNKQWGI